jgi:AhpD family alkylhydroperoxidase
MRMLQVHFEKQKLGLVASAVLRCDDCVKYHLETSHKIGVTKEEMMEAMGIATLVVEPSTSLT